MLRLLAELAGIPVTDCEALSLEIIEDAPRIIAKSLWYWVSGGTVEARTVHAWWCDLFIEYRIYKWSR